MRHLLIHADRMANCMEELLKDHSTFTVGELIEHLSRFDRDMPVATYVERNLTCNYGNISYSTITEEEEKPAS